MYVKNCVFRCSFPFQNLPRSWPVPTLAGAMASTYPCGAEKVKYISYSPSHSARKPWGVCVPWLVRAFWTLLLPGFLPSCAPFVQANRKFGEPTLEAAKQRLTLHTVSNCARHLHDVESSYWLVESQHWACRCSCSDDLLLFVWTFVEVDQRGRCRLLRQRSILHQCPSSEMSVGYFSGVWHINLEDHPG